MKYTLAVDRGNTAAKAAIYADERLVDAASAPEAREAVEMLLARCNVRPEAAIYSTVGRGGEQAMAFLREYAPRVVSVADDITLPIAVPSKYRSTLGADRVAAAAGAYKLYAGSDILVVDSGTAVTYDLVSADGTFVGGNIAPGIRMSLDAMHHYTALLPRVAMPEGIDSELLGSDTESAMLRGAIYSIVGAIESMYARLSPDTKVVVTGGTSALFIPLLRIEADYSPNLVLDGLNYILTFRD